MAGKRGSGLGGWVLLIGVVAAMLVVAWYALVATAVVAWCAIWAITWLVVALTLPFAGARGFRTGLERSFGATPFERTGWLWIRLLTFGRAGVRPTAAGAAGSVGSPGSWAWTAGILVILVIAGVVSSGRVSGAHPPGTALAGSGPVSKTPAATGPVASPPSAPGPIVSSVPPSTLPTPSRTPSPKPSSKPTAGSGLPAVTCPATALRGVYHAYRLHVLGTCRWIVGVVTTVRSESDGDWHVNVAPAAGYAKLLNDGNRLHEGGALVTEIMPGQSLRVPGVGSTVAVFGTWVYDADHGWNEIHPIWAIRYGATGPAVQMLPPATPTYDPGEPPGGGGSGGGGGTNCDPAYPGVCLHDGIGDYDCAGGGGDGPNFVTGPIRVLAPDPFGLDGNHDGWGCT